MRPCMIIDNPRVLREAVAEHIVTSGPRALRGHHSRSTRWSQWVDRYAARFQELTDPEWERMIDDPQNRWYREGPAYKSLFQH